MKVGYAVLYEDGELVISKNHSVLKRKIIIDYGKFEDINIPWQNESSQIKKVQISDQVKSNCMKEWFLNCINLTTLIDFKNLDVSDCTDFSYMFALCESLHTVLVSNTLSILRKDMFYKCNPNLKIHWKNHIYTYEDLLEYQTIY